MGDFYSKRWTVFVWKFVSAVFMPFQMCSIQTGLEFKISPSGKCSLFYLNALISFQKWHEDYSLFRKVSVYLLTGLELYQKGKYVAFDFSWEYVRSGRSLLLTRAHPRTVDCVPALPYPCVPFSASTFLWLPHGDTASEFLTNEDEPRM